MRLGIRTAISALVLTSIVVSAVGVHLLWWRTAQGVSQTLANTINDQIVSAVGDELQSVTTEARSSMLAVRTLLAEKVFEPRDARKREVVFRSQLLSQPTISWVAFGWPDGSFFAGHKAGDGVIEMMEITPDRKLRTDRYEFVGNELQLRNSHVEDTKYSVTDQEWFRTAIETNDELWATFTTHPKGERLAAAFAAPIDIDKKPVGVIAIIIELTRVSNFLSQLTVGKSASAFILDPNGSAIAAPDANADEVTPLKTEQPTFPVAVDAIRQAGSAYDANGSEPFSTAVVRDGKVYKTVLTPISFPGWSLVTVGSLSVPYTQASVHHREVVARGAAAMSDDVSPLRGRDAFQRRSAPCAVTVCSLSVREVSRLLRPPPGVRQPSWSSLKCFTWPAKAAKHHLPREPPSCISILNLS